MALHFASSLLTISYDYEVRAESSTQDSKSSTVMSNFEIAPNVENVVVS
jgi:hypothetical protein